MDLVRGGQVHARCSNRYAGFSPLCSNKLLLACRVVLACFELVITTIAFHTISIITQDRFPTSMATGSPAKWSWTLQSIKPSVYGAPRRVRVH